MYGIVPMACRDNQAYCADHHPPSKSLTGGRTIALADGQEIFDQDTGCTQAQWIQISDLR